MMDSSTKTESTCGTDGNKEYNNSNTDSLNEFKYEIDSEVNNKFDKVLNSDQKYETATG